MSSSFTSLIDDIDAALADLAAGATTEVLDGGAARTEAVGRAVPVTLGLEERGAFLTASDTDARGRAMGAAFAEPTEPVGDTTELRTLPSAAGFAFAAEAEREVLTGGAVGLVGTTEALRAVTVTAGGGLAEVDDASMGLETVGGEVVFLSGGAATFAVAVAGAVDGAPFVTVGFTDPAPNVPELIICRLV